MFINANNNSYTYPVARLNHIKGKWYVLVSVPAHLRHLFPNQRDLRRSTGTDDESFAKRKQHALAQEIYDLFDQRQREEKVPSFFMFNMPFGRNARRWICVKGSYCNIVHAIARESCGAFVDK